MSLYKLRPRQATRADIEYIAANMRQADKTELETASGLSAYKALESDYATSAYAICANGPSGKPMIIFGYKQRAPGKTQCWMCGTEEMETAAIKREIWKTSKQICAQLCQKSKKVYGYVDARHTISIRWLKRLGFKFSQPINIGQNGEQYYKFEKGGKQGWAL